MKGVSLMQRLKGNINDPEIGFSNDSSRIEFEPEESKFEDAATNRSTSRVPIKAKSHSKLPQTKNY